LSKSQLNFERFIGKYSIGRDSNPYNITGSPHFLRVKVPGGMITGNQLIQVGELTRIYSKGKAEITNRQSIQLHWIDSEDTPQIFGELDHIGFTTDMCGQGFSGARYGDVRNIVCCPVSGIVKNEIYDGSNLLKKLTDFFIGNPDFLDMPRKLKFSISGCGVDCTRAWINDLAFVSVRKLGDVGFTLLVGGSSGASLPGPRMAKPTGIFIKPSDAFNVAVAAAEIHRDYGSRERKSKARLKYLIESWGFEKFVHKLEEKLELKFDKYDGYLFKNDDDHSGSHHQKQDDLHWVNIPIIGGRLTSQQMSRIGELSKEFGSGELRLTPAQNIIIPNVTDVEKLLEHLETHFSLTGPRMKWTSIACSSDFCGKSLEPHAKQLLKYTLEFIEQKFNTDILDKTNIKIHVSGCQNNCCPSNTAEIGLKGKQIRVNNELKQVYDIILCGSLGVVPSFGKIVKENVDPQEIKYRISSLLDNYLRNKKTKQSFKDYCENRVDELANSIEYT
jgi:sulfite reductase beta subunit-like hemoprotein